MIFFNVRRFYSFPVKPFFNKEPADITVLAGKTVQFHCSVGGGKFNILDYIANFFKNYFNHIRCSSDFVDQIQ